MTRKAKTPLLLAMIFAMFQSLSGCAGDDGTSVDTSIIDALQEQIDTLTAEAALGAANDVVGEQCALCHTGDTPVAYTGADHQAYYDQFYQDQVLRVINLAYTNDGVNDIVTFDMTKKNEVTGAEEPFDCLDATSNPLPDQDDALNINFVQYDPTTREFSDGAASTFWKPIKGTLTSNPATGSCTSTKAQSALGDLSLLNGHIAVYGRDETLTSNSAKHIANPKFPFATILKLGTDYVSNAKSEGCENCHTKPFLKHAYIYGEVNDGTNNDGNDFYVCKTCHLDQRNGGHQDWQILADDPVRHAEIVAATEACVLINDTSCDRFSENMTPDELTKYAYKTSLMNDAHMSHSMEFGFPQSMKTCATCHSGVGQVAAVLADEYFTGETCRSCHSIDGLIGMMNATAEKTTIHSLAVDELDNDTFCIQCHSATPTVVAAPLFSELHTGYDEEIYADAATGTKYSEAFTVTVKSASVAANVLTIEIEAIERDETGTPDPTFSTLDVTDIEPTIIIGPYGYDTKHFIIGPHDRDIDDNGDGILGRRGGDSRNLEYTVGDTHARFTTVSAANGNWVVTADMSFWADMITDGIIKRVEIGVMPVLDDLNGDEVAMNAPSRTFDLGANAFDDTFFPDVVDVLGGCNSCHDALATTFHSGKRGGNIKICKMCHTPFKAGSHLEMQSRAIDSYVHAVHSFQVFDIGDIDESDPVEAAEHAHHIKAEFPNFGIENCEACHNPGTYDVPDQGKSLPSLHAGSDDVADRNIGTIPKYVMGPASRACGACHRAQMTKEDDANRLSAFNAHVAAQGYLVEDGDGVWDTVVKKIMSMF